MKTVQNTVDPSVLHIKLHEQKLKDGKVLFSFFSEPGMACTIEKVLADARMLVDRLREHDGSAESLIAQTQTLNKRVEAMKQVSALDLQLSISKIVYWSTVLIT